MRKWTWVALAIAAALLGATGWVYSQYRQAIAPAAQAPLDARDAERANRFIAALERGAFDEAHAMFDARAKAALPPDKLAEVWTTLPKQLGGAGKRDPARGIAVDGTPLVAFRIAYPMMALEARLGFDAEGAIHTFRMVPAPPAAAAPPPADAAYTEVDFKVAGLPGTLAVPRGDGPFPAVVLVHGSGAHDRDETIGPNKPFRDLARGLAARGIAALRYEKRSFARPQDFAGDYTVDLETVDDAVTAVAALRGDQAIDPARVFVAGHSLGAMMAPRIAQRAQGLAGVILLAAPARALVDVVPAQVRYLAALEDGVSPEEQAQIAQIDAQVAATRALGADDPPRASLLLGLPAAYWRDLAGYDPVAVQRALELPLLVLQGGRDYQVTPSDDFAIWQVAFEGDPRAELVLYPSLNHLFIAGEGAPGPKDYVREGEVDAAVVATIADWIGRTTAP
jgi:dienelactone hydrolase